VYISEIYVNFILYWNILFINKSVLILEINTYVLREYFWGYKTKVDIPDYLVLARKDLKMIE